MGRFRKCASCGANNREYDRNCYQCQDSLADQQQAALQAVVKQQDEVEQLQGRTNFYGRLAVFALALWVCKPYFSGRSVYGIFEWAILPFHEAGHYILMPFAPEFLMVAGGSFVQLALPLGFALYFLLKRKEAFSACVPMLWLFGSMQQMGWYMKDARFLLLPILGADPTEAHDWNYLFGKMHLLHRSVAIGEFFIGLARLGVGLTLVAMAVLLFRDSGLYSRWTGSRAKPAEG